jgi:hypothetical protein
MDEGPVSAFDPQAFDPVAFDTTAPAIVRIHGRITDVDITPTETGVVVTITAERE